MATHVPEGAKYRVLNTRQDVERTTALAVALCAALAALAGAGATVTAIIGVTGIAIVTLTAVSALVVGAGLMLHATGVLSRAKRRHHSAGDRAQELSLIGGASLELIGGAGAVVLGLTVLGGVLPSILLPAAALAAGGGALLGGPAHYTTGYLARRPERRIHALALHGTSATTWLLLLSGTAAIFLGTLALLEVQESNALILSCVAFIGLGSALLLAAAALALRFGAQLWVQDETGPEDYTARILDLLTARLTAARTGYRLYDTVIAKLRTLPEPTYELVIPALETFASKELANISFLEAQIDGFGGDVRTGSGLASVERQATSGIEDLILGSGEMNPMHLLYALHAADMSDAAGWKLLMQVVDEIGHHELKKEVTIRHGDKSEQVRYLSRILERVTRHVYVGEPIDAPISAYN